MRSWTAILITTCLLGGFIIGCERKDPETNSAYNPELDPAGQRVRVNPNPTLLADQKMIAREVRNKEAARIAEQENAQRTTDENDEETTAENESQEEPTNEDDRIKQVVLDAAIAQIDGDKEAFKQKSALQSDAAKNYYAYLFQLKSQLQEFRDEMVDQYNQQDVDRAIQTAKRRFSSRTNRRMNVPQLMSDVLMTNQDIQQAKDEARQNTRSAEVNISGDTAELGDIATLQKVDDEWKVTWYGEQLSQNQMNQYRDVLEEAIGGIERTQRNIGKSDYNPNRLINMMMAGGRDMGPMPGNMNRRGR